MKLPTVWVGIPTLDAKRCVELVHGLAERASYGDVEVRFLVWWNGDRPADGPLVPHLITQELTKQDAAAGVGKNIGVTSALDGLYDLAKELKAQPQDILLYLHDDVVVREDWWDTKLALAFEMRPEMALAGFGGAKGLGDPDLYKKPYELTQLARREFVSNMDSAEQHGRRIVAPERVATLDLFSIAARMSFLHRINGWAWWKYPHHSLDNAICCLARRHGLETWVLPFSCEHYGGKTSTRVDFQKDFGKSEGEIHAEGHVALYNDYKDVLPFHVA